MTTHIPAATGTGQTHSAPSGSAAPGALAGRTALVTGGAGAIGRAVARRFMAEGATVAVADLDVEAAQRVAADLQADIDGAAVAGSGPAGAGPAGSGPAGSGPAGSGPAGSGAGGSALGIGMNVADPDDVERAAAELTDRIGVCDALVLNAGILVLKDTLALTGAEWSAVISVNLTGAFHTASVFGRRLVASGRPGTITFTSSLFGVRGGRRNGAYSASKFGIIGLAQSMAAELAEHGIRVNSVCPGQIRTPMLDDLFTGRAAQNGTTAQEEEAEFASRIPSGTLGSVDDVAKAFVYLTSDQSSYVTGQQLLVDGGWQVG